MKDSDQRRVLCALDAALEVLRNNRDSLEVADVRLQSMLTVLRAELLERLGRQGRREDTPLSEPRLA